MLAKIFRGGLTYQGAVTVILYLLNDRVKIGLAKVIKGDSELTLMFIFQASKKFKWSWFSGVLSFSEMLNMDMINSIIKDFERTFYCGMHPDQYNILWVLHTDKGRTEIHFIGPRLELLSRKHYNPYFIGRDFRKKDIFQEYINQKYGLSSYLDNQRLVYASRPKWSGEKQTHEEEIDEMILIKVKKGELRSRNDIIDLLRDWEFEVEYIGIKHIVIITDERKRLTLKGPIYGEDFFANLNILKDEIKRESPPKIGIRDGVMVRESTRSFIKLERALDEIIKKQAYGNRQRYPSPIRKPKQLQKRKSQKIKQQKENNHDSNRKRLIRFINEERTRASRRKRRITQVTEWNLWTESADHKHIIESLEQWIAERRFRSYFEQGIRAILNKFGTVKQKFARRNKKALGILSDRKMKKSLNNSFKIKI